MQLPHPLSTTLLLLAALASTASSASSDTLTTTTFPPTPTPTPTHLTNTNALCSSSGGACIDTSICQQQPGAQSIPNLCPDSPAHIRCCKYAAAPAPQCTARAGNTPSRLVGCVTEEVCEREEGTSYVGLCPGPKEIRCCVGPVGYVGGSSAGTGSSTVSGSRSSSGALGNSTRISSGKTVEGTTTTTTTGAASTLGLTSTSTSTSSSTSTGGARRLGYTRSDGYEALWEPLAAGLAGVAVYLI